MEGKRFIQKLKLTNILSYGPAGTEIELEPLNVLIGPNGSGKSNLIEAISVLKAAPSDISAPFRSGGGITEWRWKGLTKEVNADPEISATVVDRVPSDLYKLIVYHVTVSGGAGVYIAREKIESPQGKSRTKYDLSATGEAALLKRIGRSPSDISYETERIAPDDVNCSQSVLAQFKDRWAYPEITYLGEAFSQILFLRSAAFGHRSALRGPQRADEHPGQVREDGSNYVVVLNDLLSRPPINKAIVSEMKKLSPSVENVTTKVFANTIDVFVHEAGLVEAIPSVRLSDGYLRYLFLLAVLFHPEPPPLVCIEDPEIGLHPDALSHLARLLKDAAQRMQLIVTTQSDVLVSALSDVPEAVIVCERDERGTHLRRLQAEPLSEWLDDYQLGELWAMGKLGGNL